MHLSKKEHQDGDVAGGLSQQSLCECGSTRQGRLILEPFCAKKRDLEPSEDFETCAGWFCVNVTQTGVITEKGASVEEMPP